MTHAEKYRSNQELYNSFRRISHLLDWEKVELDWNKDEWTRLTQVRKEREEYKLTNSSKYDTMDGEG